MNTYTNKQGEEITTFKSHRHPENRNFMQVVCYMIIVKPTGKTTVIWHLANASANDVHYIYDITKKEAIDTFIDEPELTEEDFQKWLAGKNS